jgi:hypothetical protein
MSLKSDLAAALDGYIRSAALRLLADLPEYRANDVVIADAVRAIGHGCTSDQIRGHLTWLEEQRLVTLADLGGVTIATLTERGADVAAGRTEVPGVHRPKPGR